MPKISDKECKVKITLDTDEIALVFTPDNRIAIVGDGEAVEVNEDELPLHVKTAMILHYLATENPELLHYVESQFIRYVAGEAQSNEEFIEFVQQAMKAKESHKSHRLVRKPK